MMDGADREAFYAMERELNRYKILNAAQETLVASLMDTADHMQSHLAKQIESLEEQLMTIPNKAMASFVKQLNACFEYKDVKARVMEGGGFSLRIEERDIEFDEKLAFVGRGINFFHEDKTNA